jgi:hypothetical protein
MWLLYMWLQDLQNLVCYDGGSDLQGCLGQRYLVLSTSVWEHKNVYSSIYSHPATPDGLAEDVGSPFRENLSSL